MSGSTDTLPEGAKYHHETYCRCGDTQDHHTHSSGRCLRCDTCFNFAESLVDDPQAVERARKAAEPYALLSGLEMQEVLRAAEGGTDT